MFFFVRHGESQANAGFQTANPATIALTDFGHQQAHHVAAWFSVAPALIVTSHYLRTQQTAAPTLARFPHVEHQIWDIHEFTYLSPTLADHTTPNQRQPLVEAYWATREPTYCDGDGAESFAQFVQRAEVLLERLRHSKHSIVLFSYGQFINMLRWRSANPTAPITRDAMQTWWVWNRTHPIANAEILQSVDLRTFVVPRV